MDHLKEAARTLQEAGESLDLAVNYITILQRSLKRVLGEDIPCKGKADMFLASVNARNLVSKMQEDKVVGDFEYNSGLILTRY